MKRGWFFGRVILAACLAAAWPCSARADDKKPEEYWEPGIIPAVNYDSDIGFGFGAIGSLARFEPGYEPFRARLEAQVFLSVAVDAAGDASVPHHDDYLKFDLPGLLEDRLRLGGGLFFRKLASCGYYGIGQLSTEKEFSDRELEESLQARRYHLYDHMSAGADLLGRTTLVELPRKVGDAPRLELLTGLHGSFQSVTAYPHSRLSEDLARARDVAAPGASEDPDALQLASLLHGVGSYGVFATDIGLLFDDRDHEFWPTRGSLTELSLQGAVATVEEMRFVRLHASTRWFVPLVKKDGALVVGHRLAADFIFGDAPVYELGALGNFEPIDGPGGAKSVRGVPLGRLFGKTKLLANLELRAQAPWFTLFGERWRFGFIAFVDAGRVWSDLPPASNLDGPWSPFDVGAGGGLRLRWGETLVLRADAGYSPTRDSYGVYIDIGQVF
ncbi:MAG: BamA/TamA family outer membrane protein [Polyangiaceae bacterium]